MQRWSVCIWLVGGIELGLGGRSGIMYFVSGQYSRQGNWDRDDLITVVSKPYHALSIPNAPLFRSIRGVQGLAELSYFSTGQVHRANTPRSACLRCRKCKILSR